MKKIIAFALVMALVLFTLPACSTRNTPNGGTEPPPQSESESATNPPVSEDASQPTDTATELDENINETEMDALRKYAITFAETFPSAFDTVGELDIDDVVGRFSLWQIYYEDNLEEETAAANGVCFIAKDRLIKYVSLHFGIADYEFPSEYDSGYDAGSDGYRFFPVGEGPLFHAEVVDEKRGSDDLIFRMKLSEHDFETGVVVSESHIDYRFQMINADGVTHLKAISAVADPPDNTQPEDSTLPMALDAKRANEIMCIFGAEPRLHDDMGNPLPSDAMEYQTAVISFYYHEDGIASTEEITPYGFYGWYMQYTLLYEERIKQIIPGFERFVTVRNDPVSGEIFGVPGDTYEKIVTSFFDVETQQLRGDDLYDEEAHAYIPNGGPGIGEQPTVSVVSMEQKDDLVILDVALDRQYEGRNTFELTVREDKSNEFAGIKFVSLTTLAP